MSSREDRGNVLGARKREGETGSEKLIQGASGRIRFLQHMMNWQV